MSISFHFLLLLFAELASGKEQINCYVGRRVGGVFSNVVLLQHPAMRQTAHRFGLCLFLKSSTKLFSFFETGALETSRETNNNKSTMIKQRLFGTEQCAYNRKSTEKEKARLKKIAASQVTEIVNNLVEEKKKKEQKYDFTRVMTKYFVLVVDF